MKSRVFRIISIIVSGLFCTFLGLVLLLFFYYIFSNRLSREQVFETGMIAFFFVHFIAFLVSLFSIIKKWWLVNYILLILYLSAVFAGFVEINASF